MRGTLRERFDAKWTPEPFSGCWLWTGALTGKGGYACIGEGSREMPNLRAHRVAWELYRGKIPVGLNVLHKCDVSICVNPDHLFLGTQADNLADCRAKGRAKTIKLTDDDVRAIRSSKETQMVLAHRFRVDQTNISLIKNRKTHRHVD